MLEAPTKDPRHVANGARGAAKRWADPASRRVVRLADLEPEEQDVVRALLALKRRREADAADLTPAA